MKRFTAEFIGTFGLVFAGTGAIVINEVSGGAVTHAGIALTFGFVVLAMIYTFGDISGAHLNPAAAVGFWAARRMSIRDVPLYFPGVTPRLYWSFDDPSNFKGIRDEVLSRTREVRDTIQRKVESWCAEVCEIPEDPFSMC
jgi:hypothetical protein